MPTLGPENTREKKEMVQTVCFPAPNITLLSQEVPYRVALVMAKGVFFQKNIIFGATLNGKCASEKGLLPPHKQSFLPCLWATTGREREIKKGYMKTLRLLLVLIAMTIVGCGPQSKKVKDDGFKVTASTNEIIANGKKDVEFTATFNGDLLHEEDPRLKVWVNKEVIQLPDMRFSTDQVGSYSVCFAYNEEGGPTHVMPPFEVKAVESAPIHTTIILILFYILSPAAVLWACNRWKILNKIGPVLILYFIGIIVANLNLIPAGCKGLQDTISTIAIPLALPMMLYSCNFKNFSIRTSLKITIIGVVAVAISTLVGFYSFRDGINNEGVVAEEPAALVAEMPTSEDGVAATEQLVVSNAISFEEENPMGERAAIVGGAVAGKCTGGTPNLAALKVMLKMDNPTFIIINSFDMVICFIYLVILMTIGIKFARRWLGRGNYAREKVDLEEYKEGNPYKDFGKRSSIEQLIKVTIATLVIVAAAYGIATFAKDYNEHIFTVVMILAITTLALILSLFKEVKKWDKSYDAGMYLIYIFSVVVASMANFRTMNYEGVLYIVLFQLVVVFGSLILTMLGAKLFKVDGDTTIITSNTLINSPIFVPMIAASMKNKDIIVVGVTIGLVGYALGNYFGYMMYSLLSVL